MEQYDPVKSLIDTAAYMVSEQGQEVGPTAQWLEGALAAYVDPREAQQITNEFFMIREGRLKMGAPASEDTGPIWVESSIYHDFSEFTHYNPWTGEKCNCAWGKPRHKKRLGKLASQNVRMLRNQDQKIFRTEEGKEFLNQLENFADENPEWERMVPWLASRYKHGDVGLNGHGEVGWGHPGNIHSPLKYLPQWTNWFNADQHPLRRGVNIMEKTPEEVDWLAREHQIAVQQAQNKQNWLANYGGTSEPIHTFGPEAGQYQGWGIHPIRDSNEAAAESAALKHCFTPETLVRTIDGYRPIVDIKVGDLVLSGDGYYHPVLKKFEHDYNGPLHEIFTRVGVEPICVTPEHPFLAIEGNHARNGKCIPKCKTPRIPKQNFKLDYSRACVVRDRIKAGVSRQVIAQEFGVSVHTVSAISIGKIWVNANEPQRERLEHHFVWTNAEKLSQHRYISSNIPKVTFDLDRIEVPDQFVGNSPFSQRRGPLHYDLTPEFLWLVGLYIAEGSCNSGDIIQYSLHKDEEEYAQRIERFFGQWYKVRRRKDKPEYNGLVLQFGSRRLAQWWREWIGDRSNTKKIPIELFNLPDGKLRHVLDGILAGDGCDSSNELSQTSPMLALQVAEVSLRQGGQPSIGRHFPSHKLPYWSLLEPCGHRPTQRKSANKSGYWALADRVAVKIYRHDIKDYQGKIYNLHIEGDHTYTVQNILVHNCIGNDEQPYKHNIDQGNIKAYSLRDPQGYPHVSWHINPSGEDIGHMQGASGYPKEDYRNLISQFNQAAGLPDEEGSEEQLEGGEDASWTAPDPDNVEDLISQYNDIYEWAYNDPDANIGENTEVDMGEPQWEDIAYDALNNSRVDLDDLYKFVKDAGPYWKRGLDQAIEETEPDDEGSWRKKAYWYELNGEYLEGNPYDQMQDWTAPNAENVEEYINQAHPDKHTLQEQALDSGDPVGENTEYWPGESPKWDDIAKSFYGEQSTDNYPQKDLVDQSPYDPVRWSDPDQAATPDQVQDLYDAAISQGVGNLRSLHNALEDYGPDPNIPHEQQNWEQWQRLYNQHIDPNTGQIMHYPIMNRYQAPMFHLNPDNPSQINYLQAEPREDGLNRYMAPQTFSKKKELKSDEPEYYEKEEIDEPYCHLTVYGEPKESKVASLIDQQVYLTEDPTYGPYTVVDETTDNQYGENEVVLKMDAEGKDASYSEGLEGQDWEYVYVPMSKIRMASKIAVMTLPQQQRAWTQLQGQYPQGDTVHAFPDNWTVQRHNDTQSMRGVGLMMRNCWQNDDAWEDPLGRKKAWGQYPHSIHDPNGIPRGAFWVAGYGEDQPPYITHALGARNKDLDPEAMAKLHEFGNQFGYHVPTIYPQGTVLSSAPWGNHDPLVCPGCGSALLEPQQIGRDWSSYCPSCHGTYKIPPFSPLLKSYQNEWAEYPEELKQVGKPSPWADIVTSAKKAQWDNAWWQDPAMTEYNEAEKKYGEIMPWIADELVRADKMLQQARTPQDTEQIIINMIHEFKSLLGDGPKEHQEISGYVNNWLEYHHLFTDQQGEDEGGNMGTLSSKEWEEVAPEDAFPSSSLGKYLKHIDKGITHEPAPKKKESYRDIFARIVYENFLATQKKIDSQA